MSEKEMLTDLEHRAMRLTGELADVLTRVVMGDGASVIPDVARSDLQELKQHLHGIQNAVLAQAAARAYPDSYRLMGRRLTAAVLRGRS